MPYTPGQVLGGMTVSLGTLLLGAVDSAGVAWYLGADGLQGWDAPDTRTQYADRQADHGSWAGPTYLTSRVITLAGTVVAPSQAALDLALDQLSAACSLTDTLLTVGETVPKQAVVRRSGRPLMKRETNTIASWSVMVTAADPRRYSTVLQTASTGLPTAGAGISLPITLPVVIPAGTASGQLTLTNAGSISTRPVFTITGPVTTPTILVQYPDSTVRQLVYSDTLNLGDVLTIDTDTHSVVLSGPVSRRRYLSGTWPEVPLTSSVTVQWTAASYDPAALLTATCRSAWM